MPLRLPRVTLVGVDCVNIRRLIIAAEICQREIVFGGVKLLTSLPTSHPDVVPIHPIRNLKAYSRFMIRQLHDYVDTEYALVIQYDGFVLNPRAWSDDFLAYDYVGAPWWYTDGHNVGNGGFSLRSKRLLSVIQRDKRIRRYFPEDHHLCRTYRQHLETRGIRYAPESVADRFSIEGQSFEHGPCVRNVWTGQFGFHGLHKTDISEWLAAHPDVAGVRNVLKQKYRRDVQ